MTRATWTGPVSRPTNIDDMRERLNLFRTEKGDALADQLNARPTDVFIATYPKCGTTLLQQLVHALRTRGDENFDEITDVVPWLEVVGEHGVDPDGEQIGEPRAFKTHRSADNLPTTGRFIHMTREPFAMADSFYRFFSGWFFEPGSITKDDFAEHMILAGSGSGKYWDHLACWWPKRHEENVLFLCYEDFVEDPESIIQAVAEFIDIPLDADLRALVLTMTSIEYMKAHKHQFDDHRIQEAVHGYLGLPADSETSKVAQGGGGAKRDQLSKEIQCLFDMRWQEEITDVFGLPNYESLRHSLRA